MNYEQYGNGNGNLIAMVWMKFLRIVEQVQVLTNWFIVAAIVGGEERIRCGMEEAPNDEAIRVWVL